MTAARVELGAPTQLSKLFLPPLFTFLRQRSPSPPLSFVSISRSERDHRAPDSEDLLLQPSIVFRHNSKLCLPCCRREGTNEPVRCDCNVWLLFSAAVPWCEKMIRYTFRTETAGEYQCVFTECFPIRRCTYGKQLRDFVFGKSLDIHAWRAAAVLPRDFGFILQIDWISKHVNRYKMYGRRSKYYITVPNMKMIQFAFKSCVLYFVL